MEQYIDSILGDAKLEQFLSQETDVKFKNQFILMYNYLNKVTNGFKNLDIISQEAETFEKFNTFLSNVKLQNGDLTADDRDVMLNILQKYKNYIDNALKSGVVMAEDLSYELDYFDYIIEGFEYKSMEVMDIPYIIEQMSKNEELISEVAKMFDMTSPDDKFGEVIFYLSDKYDEIYRINLDFTPENLEKINDSERAKIKQELFVFKSFNEHCLKRSKELLDYYDTMQDNLIADKFNPEEINPEYFYEGADFSGVNYYALFGDYCELVSDCEGERPCTFEEYIKERDPFYLCQHYGDVSNAKRRIETANRILNDINELEKVVR